MNSYTYHDYGALLLRVSLGVVMLAHSAYLKLFVFTLPGTAQFFTSISLPGWFAYLVFLIEVIGGIALILGAYIRIAALSLSLVAMGATWAHFGSGWLFSNQSGGWEYPLFLVITLFVQALIGSGAYAIHSTNKLQGENV